MDLTVSVLNVINALYFPRVQKNPEVFIAHTHQDKLVDFQSEYFIQTLLENWNAYFFIFLKNERCSLSFFGDKPDIRVDNT